ncbi:GntR family transcriptional regulator [Paenibacillus cymbidii]|uniref:GntR family transcriptional regulator n=1 Tax=Paenibacillus cymbidii TaxID=1639034 RepID=UPI0014369A5B|nr:GntR family transcriptional regulator [Paenibacillus cymbidii]
MTLGLDKNNPSPLYVQARDWIKSRIAAGEWQENGKLPNEDELAVTLGISRGTLKQAIRKLIEEAVLVQIQGKGTFVVGKPLEQPLAERLVSVAEALEEDHRRFTTRLLRIETTEAGEYAGLLNLEPNAPVYALQRLRYVDNTPAVYMENYLPVALFPDLDKQNFAETTLFRIIEAHYGRKIDWGKRSFEAKATGAAIADKLGVKKGTPVTFLEQTTYTAGNEPLEYSQVWIRNDCIKLTSILKRY